MLCHRDTFDHTCFYTDIFTRRHLCTLRNAFLHTNTFRERERSFYTEQFGTETKTNRGAFTKECMCTKGFFHTDILLNYFLWRTHVWRKEFSKHMQNHSFTTAFDGRDAFRGKGLAQGKPTLQFDLNV